jgi:hypothetical protein
VCNNSFSMFFVGDYRKKDRIFFCLFVCLKMHIMTMKLSYNGGGWGWLRHDYKTTNQYTNLMTLL